MRMRKNRKIKTKFVKKKLVLVTIIEFENLKKKFQIQFWHLSDTFYSKFFLFSSLKFQCTSFKPSLKKLNENRISHPTLEVAAFKLFFALLEEVNENLVQICNNRGVFFRRIFCLLSCKRFYRIIFFNPKYLRFFLGQIFKYGTQGS